MSGDVEILHIKLDFPGTWCMRLAYAREGVNNNLRRSVLEKSGETGVTSITAVHDNWHLHLDESGVIHYMYIDR